MCSWDKQVMLQGIGILYTVYTSCIYPRMIWIYIKPRWNEYAEVVDMGGYGVIVSSNTRYYSVFLIRSVGGLNV